MKHEIIGNAELWLGDCLEILPTLGPVDAVVTDPPYGAGREFENDDGTPVAFLRDVFQLLYSICADDSFLIHDWARQRIGAIEAFRGPWDFLDLLAVTQENTMAHCRVGYDVFQIKCLYGKGAPKVARRGWNLYKTSRIAKAETFVHPTMKQVEVYEMVTRQFTREDSTILDPFMGSGTTGVACAHLGRKFIGIEIEPKYFDIACKRIAREYEQLKLFPKEEKRETVQLDLLDGEKQS